MGQLVHHHIVLQRLRKQHQLPVVVQIACRAAAAPASGLLPDADPAVRNAHPPGPVFRLFRQHLPGLPAEPAGFFRADYLPPGRPFPRFPLPFFQPSFMFCRKIRRLPVCRPQGAAHQHLAVFPNLQLHGFPTGADNRILCCLFHARMPSDGKRRLPMPQPPPARFRCQIFLLLPLLQNIPGIPHRSDGASASC